MKKYLLCLVLLTWGSLPQAAVEEHNEVVGFVQQWSPAERVIEVGGVRYVLGDDVEIVDRTGRKSSAAGVRGGKRVMLIELDGEVLRIVIEPNARDSGNPGGRRQ